MSVTHNSCRSAPNRLTNKNYFMFGSRRKFRQKIGDICTYYSDVVGAGSGEIIDIHAEIYSKETNVSEVDIETELLSDYEYSIQVNSENCDLLPGDEYFINIYIEFSNCDKKSTNFTICFTDSFNKINNNCDRNKNLFIFSSHSGNQTTNKCDTKDDNKVCSISGQELHPNQRIKSYENNLGIPNVPSYADFAAIRFDGSVTYTLSNNNVLTNSGEIINSNDYIILSKEEAMGFLYSPKHIENQVEAFIYYLIGSPSDYSFL